MQSRDASVPLPNYNGTNVWYAPGAAINSSDAFHIASHLEEEAYLANRYMFIGLMVVMLAFILWQMPYTYVRMKAYGFGNGFRLSANASRESRTPRRVKRFAWSLPVRRIPLFDLPLFDFLLVAVLWAAGVGVAGWCQATFLTDASRSTLVVMSLTALTAGLGVKSGGIGTWVVYGYTAVNFLHRWTGRLVLLLSTLHVIAYLVVFYQAGIAQEEMRKPENYLGAMAYGGLLLTGLLSLSIVRRRWWLLFKFGHHIGILLLLAGLNYHSKDVVPYLCAIWGLLVINTVFRSVTTRITVATIRPLPAAGSTLVTFPLSQGFTPGQHVRVRLFIPSLALESHPFTIASANGENVSLVVKTAGDWTARLYDRSLQHDTIRCSIEGPYGGPLNFCFPAFRSVVCVAGGSGISFALGVVRGVVHEVLAGRSACQDVTLVWTVKDKAIFGDLEPILTELLSSASKIKSINPAFNLTLRLHHTVAEKTVEEKVGMAHPECDLDAVIHSGRPDLAAILADVISRTSDGGVGVGVCGPAALVDSVSRLVRDVPAETKKRVGGVDLHSEAFSL